MQESSQQLVNYTYLPDGKVDQQEYANGVRTKFEYNGRGMIFSVRHKKTQSNRDLAFREYWRDDRDRITAWKRGNDSYYNRMEDGRGDRYHYDPEGQLDRAWYRALNPDTEEPYDPKRGDHFQYDELGNRKEWNDVASRGAMWILRKDTGLNQYLSWENSYPNPPLHWGGATNYDADLAGWGTLGNANGVLMQDGHITASFNALNQPMGIWAPAYGWGDSAQWMWSGHDPLGRCVKRWMGTSTGVPVGSTSATYYYYDGWSLVQEGNAAGAAARLYVHGGGIDEIVKSVNYGNGQSAYHHYDARSHCILLSNTSGAILEQYDYDAFGLPYFYNATGAKQGPQAYGNRFLFTGREYLSDLKLYDYRNRLYQPELGRFLQPDPKAFAAGDYNLYRYCHNDPVNRTDPLGLAVDVFLDLGFIGYDIYKLVASSGNQAENWRALGLDVGAAVIPFATGAGTAYRTAKAMERAAEATNAVKQGRTVLGKFPEYRKLADEIGAKRFNIPTEIWNKMSSAEQWAANQKFLDRVIARGDEIILSNPVKNIGDVSGGFRRELDYLTEKGFKLNNDGTTMIRTR